MKLLNEFSDCSSSIEQTVEVVIYLELLVLDEYEEEGMPETIYCELFPSVPEMFQYIVPWSFFLHKREQFQRFMLDNKVIGQSFKSHHSAKLFSGR